MPFLLSSFFLFLSIASIILMHICIVARVLRQRNARRQLPVFDEIDFGLRLSPKELMKLPSFVYVVVPPPSEKEKVVKDCPICLEGFVDGENCRALPGCEHVYHSTCIDTWLTKANMCPICRRTVEFKPEIVLNVCPLRQDTFRVWI
ncbi:hypothetical protein GIB67_031523 [Kingdonia uniflora]|uniref:RING-type domain-containing protein n=1 Tax=Kingdonia uniflora TaxID=39325 RepID=A0A7J7MNQ8_9MAGN|nr:hypothetical protein GIB67_031523 [Kingdonia uniflora]